jgi:hypothetical protein
MRAKVRKLVIGVALVVAFTLLVLQPFLLPINAQTTTTLPSSSNTSVVESTDWPIKPKLANDTVTIYTPSQPEVNITINNTQAIATPAPFDQFINITLQQVENALGTDFGSYLWSQAESHDFLNVVFVNTSSGQPLYAWVQNFTSNWVAVWVRLPNGIPAHGAVNITMEFTNASQYPYTGIYSAIYKGYDNGNYTFAQYGYFNDTVPSGWKTGAHTGGFSPTPTTSGLELLNFGEDEGTYVYAPLPSLNGNYTVIVSWWYDGDADALDQELYGNVSVISEVSSIGSTDGGDTPYAAGGTVAQNEIYISTAYIKNASTYQTTSFDGQGTYYVTTYFAIQGNTQYYGYSNHASPFQITLPSSFVTFHLLTDKTAPTVFISAGDALYVSYVYLDTVIVIPTPPNNVMPAVVAVRGGCSSGPVAGQYIAWGYKPTGNTLNITIQIKNYTTGIHGFPGLVIYSANMGNYTNDNSTSGFSAILVSFTGAVAYHSPDASTYTFINTSAFPEPKPPFNMTVILAKDSFGDTSVFKVYINKTVYILNVSLPLPWSQIGYIGLRADPGNIFTSTDPTVTAYNTTVGATTTFTTTTTTTKTIANTTITSTTTTTTTTTVTATTTTTTSTTTTTTLTTTSTVTATKVVTTTTTSTVTSTVTTAVTTVYVTTTYVTTSTVTVKSATSSGLSLSSIYVLVAVVTILVAIPAGIMASRSTAQDSGRRYVQKA